MDRGMYVELIQDYARHPRNFGRLDAPDISHEEHNPLCGDVIRIDLRLGPENRVTEARFSGRGCAISQAAASMLVERLEGQTLDEIKTISKEEMLAMLGVPISMARLKCALLGLKVLKAGAYGLQGWPEENEETAWPTTSR
jgi:nitrogen fixation NifU-like protein